jgi:hypothetical protein
VQARPPLGSDDLLGRAPEQLDVGGEEVVIEVAHDEADRRAAGRPLDGVGVDEPLAPAGGLGREPVGGQRGQHAAGQPRGVDELARGETGVDVDALDGDDRLRAGERLVLQLADLRAVERVRAVGAEALDVE